MVCTSPEFSLNLYEERLLVNRSTLEAPGSRRFGGIDIALIFHVRITAIQLLRNCSTIAIPPIAPHLYSTEVAQNFGDR